MKNKLKAHEILFAYMLRKKILLNFRIYYYWQWIFQSFFVSKNLKMFATQIKWKFHWKSCLKKFLFLCFFIFGKFILLCLVLLKPLKTFQNLTLQSLHITFLPQRKRRRSKKVFSFLRNKCNFHYCLQRRKGRESVSATTAET